MADQALHLRPDADLEAALRAFGEDVAVAGSRRPTSPAIVRARIESSPRTAEPARLALELVAGTARPGGRGPDPARCWRPSPAPPVSVSRAFG